MTTKSKMTDVCSDELRATTGGVNFATIEFLQTTSNLSQMQVSALKYYNQLEHPSKYEGLIPDFGGGVVSGNRLPRS